MSKTYNVPSNQLMRLTFRRRFRFEYLEARQLLASSAVNSTMGAGDSAAGEGLILPDLLAWENVDRGYLHDYVIEGDLLRFTTALANAGSGDLELRAGPVLDDGTQRLLQRVARTGGGHEDIEIDGSFTYHPTHEHIHFDGYAVYNLRQITPDDGVGEIVASGGKVSFCLLDVTRYTPIGRPSRFGSCGSQVQGVTAGWSDVYDRSLPDQWINISGIPDGEYWLEITVDPDNQLLESNESNNTTRIRVDLIGGPANQGDRFELNDTFETATNLGTVINRQEPTLSLHHAEDVDYFRLTVAEPGELTLSAEFTNSLGNIDLHLYDVDQNLLASAESDANVEVIHWTALAGDEFYLEVSSGDGRANGYELLLSGPGTQRIVRVPSADNGLPRMILDNEQFGTPGPATVSTLQGPDLEIQDLNVVLDDLSHSYLADLRIELIAPSGTSAVLIASGWEQVEGVFAEVGSTTGFSGTVLDDQAAVNLTEGEDPYSGTFNISHTSVGFRPLSVFNGENAAGTWQLRVTDWAGQDTGMLTAWGLEFTASLVGDRHEPNNDLAQAVLIDPNAVTEEEELSIHVPGDLDYFRVATISAGQLGVEVTYEEAESPVEVALVDSQGEVVAHGTHGDGVTRLSTPVGASQLYYVRVSADGTVVHRYGLRAQVRGDINHDAQLDSRDIDALFAAIATSMTDVEFDLNWDGQVDQSDADTLVRQTLGTDYGDANLDGLVDGADFAVWSANRFTSERTWSDGDFNGDRTVDAADFHLWLAHRFTSPSVASTSGLAKRTSFAAPATSQALRSADTPIAPLALSNTPRPDSAWRLARFRAMLIGSHDRRSPSSPTTLGGQR